VDVVARRFDVYLVPLDPTVGAEMKKTRPCVIISPDEMNESLLTVMISPLTSTQTDLVMRVRCRFEGRQGEVALDHIRTVDKRTLIKRLGKLDAPAQSRVAATLVNIFR